MLFSPRETETVVRVFIVDDDVVELTETFTLSLATTQSNVNIASYTTNISILDNDGENGNSYRSS